VFVQNLKPGAIGKLGFSFNRLRQQYPKLIGCSISGYGESGPYAHRKAYDLLIQAESGVASVTGGPEAPARVGVSIVDIAAGLNAYMAILEALIARGRTGEGAEISISMFDGMAEWMTVPLLHGEWGKPFERIGLAHAGISPYGVFKTRDGGDILISIQNDREWRALAEKVLRDASLGTDPRFATNTQRVANRPKTDGIVARVFAQHDAKALEAMLAKAEIGFGRVNDWELLLQHPHLRRITVDTPTGPVATPAPAPIITGEERRYGPVPALGEHTERIKREFGG
jgi:itaconate CoA-transferase